MAHLKHFKRADVSRVCNELEREKNADGTWKFHPTGEIDPARTHLNYVMEPGEHAAVRLSERLDDPGLKVDKRKHVNVMSDWVVTCPEELREDPDKVRGFFKLTYGFLQKRYGVENVLQGYVHMDETSPHMHVPVVPVKDGRVSAKALFTRSELSTFHDDLDAEMAEPPPKGFGRAGLIRNGRTKGDYTVAELKERTRAEELAAARDQRQSDLAQRLFNQQVGLDDRRRDLEAREKAVAAREAVVAERETAVKTRETAVEAREQAVRQAEGNLPMLAAKAAKRAADAEIEAAGRERRKPRQGPIQAATRAETVAQAEELRTAAISAALERATTTRPKQLNRDAQAGLSL